MTHDSFRSRTPASPLASRSAGLLVPVFAMRHADDFGIGDTRAVCEAIDFCSRHSIAVLQLLPIHETFGDHSPYNPISSRALSPAYLELDPRTVPGLSTVDLALAIPEEWRTHLRSGIVKHGAVHPLKIQVLQLAWHHFQNQNDPEEMADFSNFQKREERWLSRYTLFRLLIREYEGNTEWLDWRPEHRSFESASEWLLKHPDSEELQDLRTGYAFIQWVAHRQWDEVRTYADSKDVMLMGEMSFGVGRGSSDVWGHPDLFDLDWNLGTRPLSHFDTSKDAERWGQNWGLPSYRWENHRAEGFAWLRSRVTAERRFFHLCRLDHLRGYFRAYTFPWPGGPRHVEFSNLTAEEALIKTGGKLPRFVPGPDDDPLELQRNEIQGREIIGVIREAAGPMELVAELMGEMPEYMSRALVELPLANLVFPQLERNDNLPDISELRLRELSLVTYANHDNAPLASLYLHLQQGALKDPKGKEAGDLAWILKFAGWDAPAPPELDAPLLEALQSALLRTPCKLAVLMCSDLLGIPLRFNLPGSYGLETWCDRLEFPFEEYESHSTYGPRISYFRDLIHLSERAPERCGD